MNILIIDFTEPNERQQKTIQFIENKKIASQFGVYDDFKITHINIFDEVRKGIDISKIEDCKKYIFDDTEIILVLHGKYEDFEYSYCNMDKPPRSYSLHYTQIADLLIALINQPPHQAITITQMHIKLFMCFAAWPFGEMLPKDETHRPSYYLGLSFSDKLFLTIFQKFLRFNPNSKLKLTARNTIFKIIHDATKILPAENIASYIQYQELQDEINSLKAQGAGNNIEWPTYHPLNQRLAVTRGIRNKAWELIKKQLVTKQGKIIYNYENNELEISEKYHVFYNGSAGPQVVVPKVLAEFNKTDLISACETLGIVK